MSGPSGQFVKISRRYFDSPEWLEGSFSPARAWIDLIAMAAWKTKKEVWNEHTITLSRGEVVGTEAFFCERWGWTEYRYRKFLGDKEAAKQITREQLGHPWGTRITLVNYEKYQRNVPWGEETSDPDSKTKVNRAHQMAKEMWAIYHSVCLGDRGKLSLTENRAQLLRSMYRDHFAKLDDWEPLFRAACEEINQHEFYKDNPQYKLPETALRNPERRSRWVWLAQENAKKREKEKSQTFEALVERESRLLKEREERFAATEEEPEPDGEEVPRDELLGFYGSLSDEKKGEIEEEVKRRLGLVGSDAPALLKQIRLDVTREHYVSTV